MDRSKAQPVLIGMGVAAAVAWVVLGDPGQAGSVESGVSTPAALASAATTGRGEAQAPYDPMPSCRVEP